MATQAAERNWDDALEAIRSGEGYDDDKFIKLAAELAIDLLIALPDVSQRINLWRAASSIALSRQAGRQLTAQQEHAVNMNFVFCTNSHPAFGVGSILYINTSNFARALGARLTV